MSNVQEIAPGITMEWLHNDQIIAYTMGTSDSGYVDDLVKVVHQNMENWPADRPYLAIYEITNNDMFLTPHVRTRLKDALTSFPDLHGRYAAVLPGGGTSHAIRLFLMTTHRQGVREHKIFRDRETALTWLVEFIDRKQSKNP